MKVCMLSYSFYEIDARVRRYGESLLEKGNEVDVICLRRNGSARMKDVNGAKVYEIQGRSYDEKSKWSYLSRILKFFFKAAIFFIRQHPQKKYDLIHVHNIPDFLVFAAIGPKLFGAKIILDIHDILPEFFASKFKADNKGLTFRLLVMIERFSIAFSNHVIISNHLWAKTLISRSIKPDDLSVLINYPDDTLYFPRVVCNDKSRMIMMYPGTLNWHQGVDIAIKAFGVIKDELPNLDFHIYGIGPNKCQLETMVNDLELGGRVVFGPYLSLEEIPAIMAKADIGVVPKRDDSFGGMAFSTKILQFMALGVPVVVSKTRIDQYYFDDTVVRFFEPDNEQDLARQIKDLALGKGAREELVANALSFVKELAWSRKKNDYLNLVDRLVSRSQLR